MTDFKRKLIEVALPLDAINRESAREKSIRHGHPSTLHLWWARRPLAAARAVLWSSLVDDPSSHPDKFPTEELQEVERQRLFRILEELVKWENSNNEQVLEAARAEIVASCDGDLPRVLDPFCGGGTIPLEAQRLGLEALGGDLNPVAVLISKAMVEIPPRFAGLPPVNPESRAESGLKTWERAQGLAEDVRYYGKWMRDRALERLGHLFPLVSLPVEEGGGQARAVAWIWTRTVSCPNPACLREMPLLTSYLLNAKRGHEVYLIPDLSGDELRFHVGGEPPSTVPNPKAGQKRGISGLFECVWCGNVTTRDYVAAEGQSGNMGTLPTAIVVESPAGRRFLAADPALIPRAKRVEVEGLDVPFSPNPRDVWCRNFGLDTPNDLFTSRQLAVLDGYSTLLAEVIPLIKADALNAGLSGDGVRLRDGGSGAAAYADATATYLAFGIDRLADISNALCRWENTRTQVRNLFTRQTIPMMWDFAEANAFGEAAGDFQTSLENVARSLERLVAEGTGDIRQRDAATRVRELHRPVVCTDPPYYDNISYSDLSDFFYAWLRRNLKDIWPDELSTLVTPKSEELVAAAYRHGSTGKAQEHFEQGLRSVFDGIAANNNASYPTTVFYAFKQAETTSEGTASTGWETFLEGLLGAGLGITATWPVRTELSNRTIARGTAALASSIVVACRPRSIDAALASTNEFRAALKAELPVAIRLMQRGAIAPVDLAQSAIGPGMAVFSRFSKVVEADGSRMAVRRALQIINEVLDEVISEEETEFDSDTRWAVTWYRQFGLNPGQYGTAETLSKAKNTSVAGVIDAGFAASRDGKVWLLGRDGLDPAWDPVEDRRSTVWEATQHLVARLERSESEAAGLLRRLGGTADRARQLAYLLYRVAEQKGWAQEAVAYNSLVVAWPELDRLSGERAPQQQTLGGAS